VERSRSDQLTQFYTAGSLANSRHTLYGLSAQLEALDYRWNPSRGYSLFLEGATGLRETSIAQGEFTRVANRPLSRTEAQIDLYLPTFKRQTIYFSLKGAAIWSDSLYENEAYRIGGLRTIRGINEESIFATAWCVGTIEYRWLPEENSAIYVFIDQAWYEYKSLNGYLRDIPISAGIGFNVDTRAGIFTFNYALGSQFDNPVLVRNGKISFGFRSLF
jgi:hemolysin activation/secretion protein